MSIKTMNRVWEHSDVGGSELLVLLAIADYAHDDGGGAWPSSKTLARKTKLSQRQVQRIIQGLEECGEIGIERRTGPRGTNMYTVLSGLKSDHSVRKCFMCETPESETELEDHHTRPGDDSSIIPLCPQCHYKITALQLGYDKMSYDTDMTSKASDATPRGDDTTQQCHPIHYLDPLLEQEEPPSAGPLPDSEIDEIAASFKTPPPRERRTAEQVKAGIGKALETFSRNGDGRAGVADPTKAGDGWDAAVVEFCAQFLPGVPADSLPEKKRAHWRSKIRELTEETLNGKATPERAAQVMEPFAALEHWLVGPTTTPYKTSWADGFKVMLVADPRAVRAQTQQGNGRHDGAAGGNRVEGNGFRAMPKGPGR